MSTAQSQPPASRRRPRARTYKPKASVGRLGQSHDRVNGTGIESQVFSIFSLGPFFTDLDRFFTSMLRRKQIT
jgi:hypothetical protein